MIGDLGFVLPLARQITNAPFTYAEKRCLAKYRKMVRDDRRRMTALGYRQHETDWEIHRGAMVGQVIVDAQVSADGKYVWTKIGPKA